MCGFFINLTCGQGDDISLPVCSVSCIVQARPESTYNKQICSTISLYFMAYTISKGLAYIITLYTLTSLLEDEANCQNYSFQVRKPNYFLKLFIR